MSFSTTVWTTRFISLVGAATLAASTLAGCSDEALDDADVDAEETSTTQPPRFAIGNGSVAVTETTYDQGRLYLALDRAIAPGDIDLSRVHLVAIRPDATGTISRDDVQGDVSLSADGRTLEIELAETPREGAVYHAVYGEPETADGVFKLAEAIVGIETDKLPPNAVFINDTGAIAQLALASTLPADGAINVARNLDKVKVTFKNGTIDCSKPFAGKEAFHVYGAEPTVQGSQQEMYPGMTVYWGAKPTLLCDQASNSLSLLLPGQLMGGARIMVSAKARATDGSVLSTTFTFRTANPGLKIDVVEVTNEIYQCDAKLLWSNTFRCDILLGTRVATGNGPQGWVGSQKLPMGAPDWKDFPEDTKKSLSYTESTIYQYNQAVGDPVAIEFQAFDADNGDAVNQVVGGLGYIGIAASPFYPPAGVVGGALLGISKVIPINGNEDLGGGTFYQTFANRWGMFRYHTIKLPGRAATSQVVVKMYIDEYPASWNPGWAID